MMTATERAYAFTKRRILDGRFAGGALISEADVAEGVQLSRTPVREAFVRLESEGLLRLYPKRGALVVPVSAEEVESVMETRLLVERHAIAKVIHTGTEVRARLDRAIARQEDLAAREATPAFVEADRGFHRIFVAAAGNPILLALYDSLRDRQSRMGLVAIARDDGSHPADPRRAPRARPGRRARGTRRARWRCSRRTSARRWRCCAPPPPSRPGTRPRRAPSSGAAPRATAGRTRATRARSRSRRRRR